MHIEKLEMLSDTDYVLVVSPAPVADPDPLFGHCSHFEVHGSFEKLDGVPWFVWWYHGGPKKPEHLAALATLRQFLTAGKTIRLGWMGEGFHPVTPENTCIVESRALQLFSDDPLMPAIYSYFHVV